MNELQLQSHLHTTQNDDNLYLVSALYIDGEPVADFNYYATLLQELQQSIESSGNYFILTCWCGIPECAGIYQPVQVVHEGEFIKWRWLQPEPQRTFVFQSAAYKQAIENGIAQIRRDVKDLWLTKTGNKDPNLHIVSSIDEPLLEPKVKSKGKRRHHHS